MTKVFIYLLVFLAQAQLRENPEVLRKDAQVLSQQGSLFKVSVARDEPLKIFVFGRKQAEVDLSGSEFGVEIDPADLSIRVKRVGPKNSSLLKVRRQENHFVVADPSTDEKVYTLEVTTESKGKSEKFNFKIDNRPK